MATAKQIAANRRNAQKSCGPKSAETKAKVSQNARKHGLCAHFHVLEGVERQEDFDAFLNQLIEDEQPVGQAEIELVVKMAEHTWLAKRAP
jgi:cytosine/adenosine deaminase-related metal-dependent hydrolase